MNRIVNNEKNKKYIVIFWMTFAIAVAVFIWIFFSINNRFKESSDLGLLTINTTEDVVPNYQNTVSASSTDDKTINEVQNSSVNQTAVGKTSNVLADSTLENRVQEKNTVKQPETVENESKVEKKELSFIAPVARRNHNRLCK